MDKIDLIINSKFIGSQQTHRKKELHQIDLQETIVLRIKRERGSHLATAYGPVGLQWNTHASSKRHQWGWWTPPWWCLDWIWWFSNLRRLELCFVDSLGFLEYLGIYRAKRWCRGAPWGHNPPRRTLVGCAPHGPPLWHFFVPLGVFWSRKNLQKVSLRLDSIWYWFSTK